MLIDDLSPKRRLFVREYLISRNASDAYRKAGYAPKHADVAGPRLLGDVGIQAAIAEQDKERLTKLDIDADRVMEGIAKIAFHDIRKAVRWGRSPIKPDMDAKEPNLLGVYPVELVPSEEMDDDTAFAVSEVSLTETGIKIKMHDKLAALEKLARATGVYRESEERVATALATLLTGVQGASLPISTKTGTGS